MSNIRIISGKYKGRKIPVANRDGLRPTGDRMRESLFNILQNFIEGALILDAFAGTGALGLESASRGAKSIVFCDNNRENIKDINNVITNWQINNAKTILADSLKLLPSNPFDLIFVDPPFNSQIGQEALDKFASDEWLSPNGLIYLEYPLGSNFIIPNNHHLKQRKKIGNIVFDLIAPTLFA